MRLFIAEKPSLAKAIASGLGNVKTEHGYLKIGESDIVTWCYGHILEVCNPQEYDKKFEKWHLEDLPIIPDQWKLKIKKEASEQFRTIKMLIAKSDVIVNAGDPDREGQLLVDEVLEYVKNTKPVKRILVNALDDKSIQEALTNLRNNKDFIGLKNSALARSRADWLVGINLSRAYSIKAQQAGYQGFSVGRVLTPTMALVVRRENEIKNFKSTTHFQTEVIWSHDNGSIPTIWKPKEDSLFLDSEGRILDQKICDDLTQKIKNELSVIQTVEKKRKQERKRLPYSLSALQIDAGKKYGYSPQQVLDIMQELYEKKLTTYPRSDCDYLPENQISDAEEILNHLKFITRENFHKLIITANQNIRSHAWNDKKISAHHAIIPTRVKCNFEKLSTEQQNLYLMVAKAYLAQFHSEYSYTSMKMVINCLDEIFIATGNTVLDLGWKIIYRNEEKADKKDEPILPEVKEKDKVSFSEARTITKQTKPPSRFNPSTLLKAMKEIHKYVRDESLKKEMRECNGIGTEATRSGIIEKLQKTGFLVLENKFLIPTEKAKMAVKILPEELTYPDTTAIWEKALEDIVNSNVLLDDFFKKQVNNINNIINNVKEMELTLAKGTVICPNCHKIMIKRKGKAGFFWGCSGYPECKTIVPDKIQRGIWR